MSGGLTENEYPWPENFDRSLVWTNEIRRERWNGGTVPEDPAEKNQWLTSFLCIGCQSIRAPDWWSMDKNSCDECVEKILAEYEEYWNNGKPAIGSTDEEKVIWEKRWECKKCKRYKGTSRERVNDTIRWGYKMCDECYAEWEKNPVEVIGKNGY